MYILIIKGLIFLFSITAIYCIEQSKKIMWLKDELEIVKSNNSQLKRVMYENDLIPERFVK